MKNPTKHKTATAQEIQRVLGPIDDEVINEIINLGATKNEVLQALEWFNDDESMRAAAESMSVCAKSIYEILLADRDRYSPDER